MPDLDAALQILGNAVNAPPPSAAAPAASAPVPSAADLQSLAASRPDAYQPNASEAQAMSADLAAIAARQNGSPPAAPDPLDNAMGILAQGAAGKLPPLAPATPPGKMSGPIANTGAGFNQTLASTLGAPVDLLAGMMSPKVWNSLPPDQQADYRANHPTAGAMMDAWSNAMAHPIGGTESIDNLLGTAGVDPRNVVAANSLDQVARAAGGGVASMVLPYAGARTALAAGAKAGPVLSTLANGSLSSNAAIGAGAGVGGYAGSQAVPKPYAPLGDFAGQLLGGGLVGGATAAAKGFARGISDLAARYAGPFNTPSALQKIGVGRPENLGVDAQGQPLSASPSQQRVAAQRILDASSNPAALPGALSMTRLPIPSSCPARRRRPIRRRATPASASSSGRRRRRIRTSSTRGGRTRTRRRSARSMIWRPKAMPRPSAISSIDASPISTRSARPPSPARRVVGMPPSVQWAARTPSANMVPACAASWLRPTRPSNSAKARCGRPSTRRARRRWRSVACARPRRISPPRSPNPRKLQAARKPPSTKRRSAMAPSSLTPKSRICALAPWRRSAPSGSLAAICWP